MALASRIAHKGKLALTDYISLIVFAISIALLSNDGILSVTSFLSAMGFSLLFVGALGAVVSIKYHRPWLTHATIEFVGMWICVAATRNVALTVFANMLTASAIWIATAYICRLLFKRGIQDPLLDNTILVCVVFVGGVLGVLIFSNGLSLITGVKYFT